MSQIVYNQGIQLAVFFIPVVVLDFSLYQELRSFNLAIRNVLLNQILFVFFVSGCNDCNCCSICSIPLIVINFLIIFMFVEFLIKELLQSCSARTGFAPIRHSFVALRIANDRLDQVFVSQVPVNCIH